VHEDTRKAVIMARGLGTRMRREDSPAALTDQQALVARTGVKALIPINGRPFLDYVVSGLADAGYEEVCLVVAPEHELLRRHYIVDSPPTRVSMAFAVQEEPRGTADAVQTARQFAGDDLFLVMNSDNYYPLPVLRTLRLLGRPGLIGFDPVALVERSNIPPERIAKYALLASDANGNLTRIVEKPDEATVRSMGRCAPVSMNCWVFGPAIFEACRSVAPSARGELELASAVQWAIAHGEKFAVAPLAEGVLDMTSRGDISSVAAQLANVDVRL
jgi:dTDP-glucose pyrophosphorylase